ncbi:MAG: nucleotidyltransferase domain-containing protein [Desulfobacterales bacterium]|nr:nucleotidyltransferase domain-containing protein [Desulfobacterales bacterium]
MNTHLSYDGKIPNFKYIETDLKKICESFGVRRLLSFGSVNTDRFGPESDIDLLVKFDKSDFADPFDRYFGLREQLEALFGRPVELVFEKEFDNPYFRETVNKTKRLIYEA